MQIVHDNHIVQYADLEAAGRVQVQHARDTHRRRRGVEHKQVEFAASLVHKEAVEALVDDVQRDLVVERSLVECRVGHVDLETRDTRDAARRNQKALKICGKD